MCAIILLPTMGPGNLTVESDRAQALRGSIVATPLLVMFAA